MDALQTRLARASEGERWDVAFTSPGRPPQTIPSSGKKCFYRIIFMFTQCWLFVWHRAWKKWCGVFAVFIYRCWSLCKLFSCWFFVALPFFLLGSRTIQSEQSSQDGLKIVKTTSECAIKQMRLFLRHRNGNSRCWDFWSLPVDNRRQRHKQTPLGDLFTALDSEDNL